MLAGSAAVVTGSAELAYRQPGRQPGVVLRRRPLRTQGQSTAVIESKQLACVRLNHRPAREGPGRAEQACSGPARRTQGEAESKAAATLPACGMTYGTWLSTLEIPRSTLSTGPPVTTTSVGVTYPGRSTSSHDAAAPQAPIRRAEPLPALLNAETPSPVARFGGFGTSVGRSTYFAPGGGCTEVGSETFRGCGRWPEGGAGGGSNRNSAGFSPAPGSVLPGIWRGRRLS